LSSADTQPACISITRNTSRHTYLLVILRHIARCTRITLCPTAAHLKLKETSTSWRPYFSKAIR